MRRLHDGALPSILTTERSDAAHHRQPGQFAVRRRHLPGIGRDEVAEDVRESAGVDRGAQLVGERLRRLRHHGVDAVKDRALAHGAGEPGQRRGARAAPPPARPPQAVRSPTPPRRPRRQPTARCGCGCGGECVHRSSWRGTGRAARRRRHREGTRARVPQRCRTCRPTADRVASRSPLRRRIRRRTTGPQQNPADTR